MSSHHNCNAVQLMRLLAQAFDILNMPIGLDGYGLYRVVSQVGTMKMRIMKIAMYDSTSVAI